ncbi:MAG: ABC transporter permease [Methanobacteriota archaeon]|nr:MAG: ABC transporter permease [Euryarchaeota archaeon]
MTAKETLTQVFVVASYEIRKYLRSRRLLGVLVIIALVVGLILGLPPALGRSYSSDANRFVGTFAGFTEILVILCGTLFAADALVSEHEKRTGYFLFPNPVRRETIVIGKLLASLAASAGIILLYYLAATIAALIVTGHVTWEIGLSAAYALAYMACVVGVAFLLSAVLKGTITATVLTFFLFFPIVSVALSAGGVQPWFIPSAASGIIGNVLTPPFTPPPPEPAPYIADVATSLAVFAVYFVVSAILATLLFRRRELKS